MKPPFAHQVAGTAAVVAHPRYYLGDVMRLGKTRQAIDAAQVLWERGELDSVLVVAPGQIARSVWADLERGQIAEYTRVPANLTLVRADGVKSWANDLPRDRPALSWYVTNYELARRPERLEKLLPLCGPRTMLVLDEANAVKSPRSDQTKACWKMADRCGRVLLLSGTPNGDNPGDLYAPFKILDWKIVGCSDWFQFRAKYAKMGGFRRLCKVPETDPKTGRRVWKARRVPVQIVGWVNLEDLYDRTRPYILRRTLDEVFDLPPALDPVTVEVPLRPATWAIYRALRDQALTVLTSGERVTASQAGVLALRLSQLTSGLVRVDGDPVDAPRLFSDEKMVAVLEWHAARLNEDPLFRAVFWCRFRAEAERLAGHLACRVPTRLLYGDQTPDERAEAVQFLGPGSPERAAALVGIAKTGGIGLDLSGASTTAYVSNEYSHVVRAQADARVLGPNQRRPCAYFDFVATGPEGQKTVDHAVLRALQKKEDLATWGAARWAAELGEE